MKVHSRFTNVAGTEFEVYSDLIARGTFAVNTETGETKMIKSGGYLSNDLSVRKAIASAFNMATFRV